MSKFKQKCVIVNIKYAFDDNNNIIYVINY